MTRERQETYTSPRDCHQAIGPEHSKLQHELTFAMPRTVAPSRLAARHSVHTLWRAAVHDFRLANGSQTCDGARVDIDTGERSGSCNSDF
jgi:hypothetical protein